MICFWRLSCVFLAHFTGALGLGCHCTVDNTRLHASKRSTQKHTEHQKYKHRIQVPEMGGALVIVPAWNRWKDGKQENCLLAKAVSVLSASTEILFGFRKNKINFENIYGLEDQFSKKIKSSLLSWEKRNSVCADCVVVQTHKEEKGLPRVLRQVQGATNTRENK